MLNDVYAHDIDVHDIMINNRHHGEHILHGLGPHSRGERHVR